MKRPAWAAAGSFAGAWASVERSPSARAVMALALVEARVISIDAAQVEALPWPGTPGTVEATRVPFPCVYLDFGLMGVPAFVDIRGRASETLLVGALCREEPGGFHIFPFHRQADTPIRRPIGRAVVRGDDVASECRWSYEMDPRGLGRGVVNDCAGRVISVLSWLQSFNVELVEASLSRRQRAREVGKGRQIALTVQVKQSKRYSSTSVNVGSANYSHRFEVRGHYVHHFENKPDGTPSKTFARCYEKDASRLVTVDGKPCFRFWVPPHVKGPVDKPFVPKVRVVE